MPRHKFEACVSSVQSALNAVKGGAHRLEVCSDLSVGGITPSYGLVKFAQWLDVPVHVLIRPRGGDFVYSAEEFDVMLWDIGMCRDIGVHGVVVGVLAEGGVDVVRMRRIMDAAEGLSVTFHRAFDFVVDKIRALEDVVALGCERILTAGGDGSVGDNVGVLADLVARARDRLVVMPGGGLGGDGMLDLIRSTGAVEFHGSARGADGETDVEVVRRVVGILKEHDVEGEKGEFNT